MEDIIMKPARRFNNVFDALYGMLDNDAFLMRSTGHNIPAVNISENDKQYEIEFAVPGAKKKTSTYKSMKITNWLFLWRRMLKRTMTNIICVVNSITHCSVRHSYFPMTSREMKYRLVPRMVYFS